MLSLSCNFFQGVVIDRNPLRLDLLPAKGAVPLPFAAVEVSEAPSAYGVAILAHQEGGAGLVGVGLVADLAVSELVSPVVLLHSINHYIGDNDLTSITIIKLICSLTISMQLPALTSLCPFASELISRRSGSEPLLKGQK